MAMYQYSLCGPRTLGRTAWGRARATDPGKGYCSEQPDGSALTYFRGYERNS